MRCPDELELARWADGQLPGERADAIRLHLEECLECRLIVGNSTDAVSTGASDDGAPSAFPPFDEIRPRLRARYDGLEPVRMAADTDGRPGVATIPSLYPEEGRLVVTFRVDAAGRVTAWFVSEEIERTRFRPLKVGDRLFLSDAEGRAILSDLDADEVLGKEVSVPRILGSATCPCQRVTEAGIRLSMIPGDGGYPVALLGVRAGRALDRPTMLLRLEGLSSGMGAVIAVSDERDARLLFLSEQEETPCDWQTDAPTVVRFDLIDRA